MTENGRAGLPAGPDAAYTTVRKNPVPAYPIDAASKASTVAWVLASTRGRARSHLDRLHELEAAGQVTDEMWFARHAAEAAA